MELSEVEYDTFLKLSNSLNSDESTKKLCLQYYLEYKAQLNEENKQPLPDDKVQIVMRCAFFLSEKSQIMYNMKGQKIRGISLSLTQTLKSFNNLDEFVFYLKEIIRKIHLEDQELQAEINQFIKRFCFILTFYNKFDSVFKRLDLQEQGKKEQQRDYLKTLMSFGWLLFIDCKARMFRHSFEIIDVTCLMVAVFRLLVSLSIEYAKPQLFAELQRESKTATEYRSKICQSLLEQFKIRDIKMFESVYSRFEDYVNNILLVEFRYNTPNDVLSPGNIAANYKKLDNSYQKTLVDPEDIDQRYFLRERVSITPSRFTPFGGRGTATKWKKQNFNSQRILNYEMDETAKEPVTPAPGKENVQQATAIRFPKSFTPTLTKPQMIFSTPMTQAMEMYNWIAEKPKRQRISPSFDKLMERVMAQQKKGADNKSKDNRRKLIQSLYEDSLAAYPLGEEDMGLLCWCIESVYFILNLPGLPMAKLIELAEVEWYHLWRVCDYFLRYDKTMPNALKFHVLDLETRVVSMELWKVESDIFQIFSPNQSARVHKRYPESDRFVRRILHQVAYQIHLLSGPLNLSESISNTLLTTVQYILTDHSELLLQHHLDQLVLCSTYSLSKVMGMHLKFNEIILKYRQVNGYTKEVYNEIIEQVQTEGRKEDIISFYNQLFLPAMKSYMIEVKNQKGAPQKKEIAVGNAKTASLLGSPFKTLIPKELLNMRPSSHMTPQTQMLYAYNESPLLRNDNQQFESRAPPTFLPSKKLLNFEAELEQTSKKKGPERLDGFSEFQDATSDFISKKFNVKKKQNIVQNGQTQQTLAKQGSGYLKTEEMGTKLARLKSKDRL